MAIKKLNPDLIALVDKEVHNWQYHRGESKRMEYATVEWFKSIRRQAEIEKIIKSITGLSERQIDSLLNQTATTAKYWKPNGEIQKDY